MLIKVIQTPWPEEDESSLTVNEMDNKGNLGLSSVKLYKKAEKDVKDVYQDNYTKSHSMLAELYDKDIANELLEICPETKISEEGWEC